MNVIRNFFKKELRGDRSLKAEKFIVVLADLKQLSWVNLGRFDKIICRFSSGRLSDRLIF